MNRDDYNHLPGIRRSDLVLMKKSPKHYKYGIETGFETTPAMNFGIAFHTFVLEPKIFDSQCGIYDKSKRPEPEKTMASNKNKEWNNELMAEFDANGKMPITPDQLDSMNIMRDSLFSEPEIVELLTFEGQFEKSFQWDDEDTGLQCKCLVDKDLPGLDMIIDLKTCASAEFSKFSKSAANFDYEFQAAYYMDGTNRKSMAFVCVENSAPYAANVFYPDPDEFTQFGRYSYKQCLKAVKDCTEKDVWPGYSYWAPRGGYILETPVWKQRDFI